MISTTKITLFVRESKKSHNYKYLFSLYINQISHPFDQICREYTTHMYIRYNNFFARDKIRVIYFIILLFSIIEKLRVYKGIVIFNTKNYANCLMISDALLEDLQTSVSRSATPSRGGRALSPQVEYRVAANPTKIVSEGRWVDFNFLD